MEMGPLKEEFMIFESAKHESLFFCKKEISCVKEKYFAFFYKYLFSCKLKKNEKRHFIFWQGFYSPIIFQLPSMVLYRLSKMNMSPTAEMLKGLLNNKTFKISFRFCICFIYHHFIP